MELKLTCPQCNAKVFYTVKDLKWEYVGSDDAPDYYIICIVCRKDFGDNQMLQPLIDELPDAPDPDLEYDAKNDEEH